MSVSGHCLTVPTHQTACVNGWKCAVGLWVKLHARGADKRLRAPCPDICVLTARHVLQAASEAHSVNVSVIYAWTLHGLARSTQSSVLLQSAEVLHVAYVHQYEPAVCGVALTCPPMEHCHLGSVESQRWPVPAYGPPYMVSVRHQNLPEPAGGLYLQPHTPTERSTHTYYPWLAYC
jgi:hypothetical protein